MGLFLQTRSLHGAQSCDDHVVHTELEQNKLYKASRAFGWGSGAEGRTAGFLDVSTSALTGTISLCQTFSVTKTNQRSVL